MIATKNIKNESRLTPCINFIDPVCGAFGSLFLRKKYSAICLPIPITSD